MHLVGLYYKNLSRRAVIVKQSVQFINQRMHIQFHIKHFKTLLHVSILSDHHQGALFLAKFMLQYSQFNSYLQTMCYGSISCCVGMCCGAVARCAHLCTTGHCSTAHSYTTRYAATTPRLQIRIEL